VSDPIQIVLFVSITVLTIIFALVGFWLVLILKEIHQAVGSVKETAAQIANFTTKLNEPVDFLSGMVRGLEKGVEVIDLLKHFFSSRHQNEKENRGE